MKRGLGKALYIFLSTLLGILLLLIFHRALVVIYYILLENNPATFSFGISGGDLRMTDFVTMLVAMFIGGWYGTWLGLNWYGMVYEGEEQPGWFHGFVPRHFRKAERAKRRAAKADFEPVHVPVRSETEAIDNLKSALPWDLDDIDNETEMIKKPVRKKAVRKTVKRKKPAEE